MRILTNEHDSETSFSTILAMSQYAPKERAEIVAFEMQVLPVTWQLLVMATQPILFRLGATGNKIVFF